MASSSDPERTAVVSGDVRLTTQQLSDLADGGAGIIAGSGASHVAYVGTGGAMLPLLIFASARAGLTFTPINYRLSAEGIKTLIARLPDPLVVIDSRYLDELGGPDGLAGVAKQVIVSDDFLAQARDAEPAVEFADPDSVGIVLFTSGTTSQPKAVELTHNNLTSYVTGTVEFGSAEPTDAALICVPPYHIAGVSAALSNLYAGRKMVYLPIFDAQEWVRLIDAEHVTSATVVPTMLDRIVTVLEDGQHRLPSLRNLAYGGSKVPLPLVRKALELLPHVGFVNAYGLTETSSTIAVLTPDDHRDGTGRGRPGRGPAVGFGWSAGPERRGADSRRGRCRTAAPGRSASCSFVVSRSPVATPGSARSSTPRAGFRPRTSPPSTRAATCSSAAVATTRSSAAGRTSRPLSWKTCWLSTRMCAMLRWSASTIRSGDRRSSRWWYRPSAPSRPRGIARARPQKFAGVTHP